MHDTGKENTKCEENYLFKEKHEKDILLRNLLFNRIRGLLDDVVLSSKLDGLFWSVEWSSSCLIEITCQRSVWKKRSGNYNNLCCSVMQFFRDDTQSLGKMCCGSLRSFLKLPAASCSSLSSLSTKYRHRLVRAAHMRYRAPLARRWDPRKPSPNSALPGTQLPSRRNTKT